MPWGGELQLQIDDRHLRRIHPQHETSAKVAADGRCDLALPSWWRANRAIKLRVHGHSLGYRELTHQDRGALSLSDELVLDVQPVAELGGTVSGSLGKPVAHARIAAFATRAGQPFGEKLGETGTNENGVYQLFAPPDMPLLITVTAMQPNVMRFRRTDGVNDNGSLRTDLLPNARQVQLAANRPGIACDFTLANASPVVGTVRWPDGTPASGCRVQVDAGTGTELTLSDASTLRWQPGGALSVSSTVYADNNGQFRVPTAAGTTVTMRVVHIANTRILGKLPTQQSVAPSEASIQLPFPVVLRAVHNGELQPHARILTKSDPPFRADLDGRSIVLAPAGTEARAEFGPLRSPWAKIRSGQEPQRIDLVMINALVELAVQLVGDHPVRNATINWRCDDGRRGTELRSVSDNDRTLRLWLDPGNYELRIAAGAGERNGTYLLPIERKLDLRRGTELTLPARFGGTFSLSVLDDKGRMVAGECVLRTPQGQEQKVHLTADRALGQFGPETVRCKDILEPGSYELIIDLGGQRVHKRYVTITERQTTAVVVRL